MELGKFSLSLTVKDIAVSRAFYEKLDFERLDGDQDQGWLIMKNGDTVLGLFQGMFDKNCLTFHPPDVRAIQAQLKTADVELVKECDPDGEGPAHISLLDPDGNPILFDQF